MKYLFVFLLIGLTTLVNAQTETAKQPNCDEIEGILIKKDLNDVPSEMLSPYGSYTGFVKKCAEGKVMKLYNYKDGELKGLSREWYENGQLKNESNWDYSINGLSRSWYEDGQLAFEGNWLMEEPDGIHKFYYENGQLKEEANFKYGELISEKCWDEDGNEIICE